MTAFDFSGIPPGLRLGTSSFSSPDWRGGFYPPHLPSSDFLGYYATRLSTVEIDATWHAMPSRRVVEAWAEKVPEGFTFAAKVPKVITHERYLEDCAAEWAHFLELMDLLGAKKGPVLLQFPYVAKSRDAEEYRTGRDFRRRLEAFLPLIPREGRFVVEVRNRTWVAPPLLDLLRGRGISLALVDITTMPTAAEILDRLDPITADFAYVRFLGNHAAMDHRVAEAREGGRRVSDWGELLLDRADDLRAWIPPLREILHRVPEVFVYFNNHYAGFAPGSLELFLRLWDEAAPQAATPAGTSPEKREGDSAPAA
jgi:uncharacterized protein YecE (DUF72 family)